MVDITTITGTDGGPIPLQSTGRGPGLVVIQGGAVGMVEYARLARNLADRFTVHLYNRRGRPGAAPLDPATYSIATDLDDLAAVLEHTGARMLFGHSGGGFVALRAGLAGLPVDRIAVYDPGLCVSGRPGFAFLEPFAAAIGAGDLPRALALMNRGVYPDTAAARLPLRVQAALGGTFLRTTIGRRMGDLLPTVPAEVREIVRLEGPASDYAGITAAVLLTAGAGSPGYFAENCRAIAAAVPRGRAVVIPRASHNSANVAAPAFVDLFADFFTDRSTAPH